MKKIFLLSAFYIIIAPIKAQTLAATENEALLTCLVSDFKNVPTPEAIIIFEGEKSKKRYKNVADKAGKFQVLLPEGDTYLIKYANYLNEKSYSKIEIPAQKGKIDTEVTIQFEESKVSSFELEVYFETGKADLKNNSFAMLDKLYDLMNAKQKMTIEIAGHTDNVGEDATNLTLSQARANVIKDYLAKKGIQPSRLSAKGYGETQAIASNDTAEGKAKNRRTEVRILKQ